MLFYFYGDNSYAATRKIKEIEQRFIKSTGGNIGLYKFTAESSPDEVVQALTTLPMFSDSSLVIISDPSHNKALCERLLAVIDRVPDKTVAVIHDSQVDKRTAWFKAMSKGGNSKEFRLKSEPQLIRWIEMQAKASEVTFSPAAIKMLIEYVGDDEWRLSNEISKLANSTDKVDEEDIRQLVQPIPRQTIFELLDSLAAGNIESALSHLDSLKSQKVHELEILTMLGWQVRIFLVVLSGAKLSDQQIIKEHKINPYVLRKAKAATRRVSLNALEAGYQMIIDTDYAIKTSGHDPDVLLEQLLIKLHEYLKQ